MEEARLLREQLAYYRARAGEYDEWLFQEDRYDRRPAHRVAWFAEVVHAELALRDALPAGGAILELACGTGLWTRRLVERHTHVVAVDASPKLSRSIGRACSPTRSSTSRRICSRGRHPRRDSTPVFFGFWLSHVPASRFDAFSRGVQTALEPGGAVFFVDSLREMTATAQDQALPDDSGIVQRRLNDGREFDIVKVFYEPAELERRHRPRADLTGPLIQHIRAPFFIPRTIAERHGSKSVSLVEAPGSVVRLERVQLDRGTEGHLGVFEKACPQSLSDD